jgi:hypothetical protein
MDSLIFISNGEGPCLKFYDCVLYESALSPKSDMYYVKLDYINNYEELQLQLD